MSATTIESLETRVSQLASLMHELAESIEAVALKQASLLTKLDTPIDKPARKASKSRKTVKTDAAKAAAKDERKAAKDALAKVNTDAGRMTTAKFYCTGTSSSGDCKAYWYREDKSIAHANATGHVVVAVGPWPISDFE